MSTRMTRKMFRPSIRRLLFSTLGSVVGILGVLLGIAAYIVETITRPKRQENFFDFYTFSPFELDLPAEEVEFAPLQGDHLVSGWYIPFEGATSTIILCPGYHGRRADTLGTASRLWHAGHNILAFEYYGHGTIVGKPVTLGYREINDFLGAVEYVKQRAPGTHIGAVGYSMGASVAIMGAARTPDVEALVFDSGFATHRSAIAYAVQRTLHMPFFFDWMTDLLLSLRAGYHFNQVEPIRDIRRIAPRPILIIHGLKDTIVDPNDAKLLYAAAGEPKELWLFPHADHCGSYFEDRVAYVERVEDFFDYYLRGGTSRQSDDVDVDVGA